MKAAEVLKECFVCEIVRENQLDIGRGTRVAMTVRGQMPYSTVSIDPVQIGHIRLFRGPSKNNLRRNMNLVISCLASGHVSIKPIENLDSSSIAGAFQRIECQYATEITTIYCDNFSSLRQTALGPEIDQLRKMRVGLSDLGKEEKEFERKL